jgi:PAS domain S-box-containing protein
VAERDFFVAARNEPAGEPALFVGSPYVSRSDGRAAIGVSMGWRNAHGDFRGAIALVAEPEFLDGDFDRIAPTPDTTLAIYRRDRELVSDGPGDGTARLLPQVVMDTLWADSAPETPRLATLPDGRRRLVAAHLLKRYPLMVVVTRDAGIALADWTRQAWLVGSFAASALLVTLALTVRYGREHALRRASEAALAAERERALRAFQAAQEGHWEWNPLTRQSHLSPRMRELLGIERDAPADMRLSLVELGTVHRDDIEPLRAAFLAHQDGRSPVFDHRFRVRQADDRWHHVHVRGQAWRDAEGRTALFSGTASDVTAEVEAQDQKRQLEDRLQRSRKLEALGTLAGGVAHDFNNILAAVIGYGELARARAAEGSGQARQLDQVLLAGQRGKALVERILSFSRGTPRPHAKFLLQPVIDEVLAMLAASLPPAVRLERRLHAPEAVISGDATMVHEAAMNLCTNAVQSMQGMAEGARLDVGLEVVDLDAPAVLSEGPLAPGRWARLSVADSGTGIAADVMPRLFEPFFTTKGPDRGTGLGLAVVRSVVADLGGAIDVQSTPGRGSCFALYLPCIDAVPDAAQDDAGAAPQGSGQTVLVVDDEAALVELAEEMLAGLGYEPVGFTSADSALAAFRADPERFDLVLTDEVMPAMSGTALAAALHAVRPGLPVILASGYGGPRLQARAQAGGVTLLLRKPLRRATLAQALAQALRPAAAARA